MRRMRTGFQLGLLVIGMLWLGIWVFLQAELDGPHSRAARQWMLRLPSPMVLFSASSSGDEVLCHEIQARRIGAEGGVLLCGPAQLVVPPEAVDEGVRFCLEDISDHMPCVEVQRSEGALRRDIELSISYLGTPYEHSGFDLSAFKIYRVASPENYEAMPSHVDLQTSSVVAGIRQSGVYVIG